MLTTAISAAFDANESKLATQLQILPTALDSEQKRLFAGFEQFCRSNGVRSLPARPTSIAAFLAGVAEGDLFAAAEAVRVAHQAQGLACPVSTNVVRARLNELAKIEPPRSWKKSEQLLFASLPADIREVISRRERERETVLRRAQNAAAEAKRQTDGAEKPVKTSKETENASEEK